MSSASMLIPLFAAYVVAKTSEEEDRIRQRRQHKWWVNPYLQRRHQKGRFVNDFNNMMQSPTVFFQNFRMTEAQFNYLFSLVEPHLVANRNTRPDAIPLKAKFAVVLEFFATGDLQCHIGSIYRISKQHLGRTIGLVCNAISLALRDELPKWNSANMLKWAQDFMDQWHFPNCIGAIDGKHCAIRAPPNSGSAFYNYKGFHSIVLLAVCDANYKFTYIDVGAYGSEGDMNAFSNCTLGKAVLSGEISFPNDNQINGARMPYYIVGDDAFPLHKRIMKPYGSRNLSSAERIFNYRLSRARRCIENAFGILSKRWQAVQGTLQCSPERAQNIVTACCYLHNFMMRTGGIEYSNIDWQPAPLERSMDAEAFLGRVQDYPKYVRNTIKDYVNSAAGAVSWQNESAGVRD